ncbi:MAG TPA: DUF4114 domain-containing protein [Tepidisphaeraceae bacterium]|jgi:hypothetical protein|nr:DUF4114 domain-containing protein [Tepidisphaeraceae bacterium]
MTIQSRPVRMIEALETRRLLSVASGIQEFEVDFQPLNAAYGSNAEGEARLTLDTTDPMKPTLRVRIDATGLQDLTAIPGAVHLAHIHGQFEGNAAEALPQQLVGPFFSGDGGLPGSGFAPVNSTVPTSADDGGRLVDEPALGLGSTRYLDFFEGLPDYGPVVMNLPNTDLPAPPDGVSPTEQFVSGVQAGTINPAMLFPRGTEFVLDTTYVFDLSDPDEHRQYHNTVGENGQFLDDRLIVLHGLTVPTGISDAIDDAAGVPAGNPQAGVPLDNGESFRIVAPVAAGEIRAVTGIDSGIYRPGPGGMGNVALPTIYLERDATFNNETGFFVTEADGSIDGIAPGEDGYAEAALRSSSRHVLFEAGTGQGALATPTVGADQNIVFYIVQDASTQQFLADNPDNSLGGDGPLAFFSVTEANPDHADHVRVSKTGGGLLEFRWEDLTNLGDRDFNDVVFPINVVPAGAPAADPDVETFAAVIETLNASGVTGVAHVTRDGDELTVTINATGLAPDKPHAQHIHGRFEGDPATEPREARNSVTPPPTADTDGDGFIEVLEGTAAYGPILLPITSPPIDDNAMPITQSFPTAPGGTIRFTQTYDLSKEQQFFDPLNGIDFDGDDVLPLPLREIVLHGGFVPAGVGEGTTGEVNGSGGYLPTLPVATGEIFSVIEIEDEDEEV